MQDRSELRAVTRKRKTHQVKCLYLVQKKEEMLISNKTIQQIGTIKNPFKILEHQNISKRNMEHLWRARTESFGSQKKSI